MTLLLLLIACKNPVTLAPGQDACAAEVAEGDPADEIAWEATGQGTARVWRDVELAQTGLVFDPVFEVEPTVVHVYEAWSGGVSDDAFCYTPYIEVVGVDEELQVRWYLEEGDETPYDTVDLEAP